VTEDRFGTARIRHHVLESWAASPTRFREDANAEEELVLGGYRDRLVVELAQNAADAAVRAGVPGRLLLRLTDPVEGAPVLVAANTGAPLDAAGVQALCTLRASAKRDGGTVGRFGVGFAAVLAVSEEPAVLSRSGGVRFSAADTRDLVQRTALEDGVAGLEDELRRRDGRVAVLRLPFEAEGEPPQGYDTAVVLPLRGPDAVRRVRELLAEVGDILLLALPGLDEIVLELPGQEPRVLADVGSRWRTLRREGELPAALLADRPVEEQALTHWSLTWALPTDGVLPESGVLNAPTPSDEPLPWPAVLIATVPMDVTRRHVVAGPVTELIVEQAAAAYADLLTGVVADGGEAWPLVVTGLPAGPVDGALREAVVTQVRDRPVLRAAQDPQELLRPGQAVALHGPVGADRAVVDVFATWLVGLVHAPRPAWTVFETLGVRRVWLSDAVESLPASGEPAYWRTAYTALAGLTLDETVREALAFLPVPLADGSVARGARGLLLASPETAVDAGAPISVPEALNLLGARVVDPEAVHPLLERLGASVAGPRALVEQPVVRTAIREIADGPSLRIESDGRGGPERSPDELRDAVLALVAVAVAAGELRPGELPWLGDLELSDEDGEPTPACALAIEDSPAADWFEPDDVGILPAWWAERWGADTLDAVGVMRGPAAFLAVDVSLEPDLLGRDDEDGTPAAELDGWEDWTAWVQDTTPDLLPGGTIAELVAVRDLDLVRPEALAEVVVAIAADPVLHRLVVALGVGGRWGRESGAGRTAGAGVVAGPAAGGPDVAGRSRSRRGPGTRGGHHRRGPGRSGSAGCSGPARRSGDRVDRADAVGAAGTDRRPGVGVRRLGCRTPAAGAGTGPAGSGRDGGGPGGPGGDRRLADALPASGPGGGRAGAAGAGGGVGRIAGPALGPGPGRRCGAGHRGSRAADGRGGSVAARGGSLGLVGVRGAERGRGRGGLVGRGRGGRRPAARRDRRRPGPCAGLGVRSLGDA